MHDPLEPFRWLDPDDGPCPLDDIFTVSFFHGLNGGEVLDRFGAAASGRPRTGFDELRGRVEDFVARSDGGDGGGHVGVWEAGEWSAAVELWGWQATLHDVAGRLSQGCRTVAVTRHDYAAHSFVHAAAGSVLTSFDPHAPGFRHGSDPEGLDSLMRGISMDPEGETQPDAPVAMSFALAAGITGVAFTPDFLELPLLVGDVRG